jgi:hypothetical protein
MKTLSGSGFWALFLLAAGPAPEYDEFAELRRQIRESAQWDRDRLSREALRPEALILPSDRTPLDVVWRRTRALLEHLKGFPKPPDLAAETEALEALRPAVEAAPGAPEAAQREAFGKLAAVRRRVAFRNPLLDFDRILFLKHNKQVRGDRHMVDQYLGFNQEKRGGVYVLVDAFGARPEVRSLLGDSPVVNGRLKGRRLEDQGSFIALDLDYDAGSILFAFTEAEHKVPPGSPFEGQYCSADVFAEAGHGFYYWRPESTFHVFRAKVDGSGLRQLTDGRWNDYDPCFLPGGRIAFISERQCGQCRCGARPLPAAVLHSMAPDGSDLIRLSWHDTNEWHPSVDSHGMIVYTRWDYIDRDSDVAHHLWSCAPDGRDPRSLHGNYPDRRESRPWIELSIRSIPGSPRYASVAALHHGEAYGSIVTIDLQHPDDRSTAQVRRVTPEVPFPESESLPGVPFAKGKGNGHEVYGTPWPLSEDFYLCVYDPGGSRHGICLVDSFGNREVLYRDPAVACLDPIPLKPRPRPPVIPPATVQAEADRPPGANLSEGTVAVMNVYRGEHDWPRDVKIRELRVVNLFPKDNYLMDVPNMGAASQSLGRGVLGTVPVEEDGSVHFRMPTGAAVYFQLLDGDGVMVQTMRSDTYLHPGERMTCLGCHESKRASAPRDGEVPRALRREPSALKPEGEGSYPLTFPRLVQPVLDAKCAGCHERDAPKLGLRGDRSGPHGWSEAFVTLKKFSWGMAGGNGTALRQRQYSIPGQEGARASRLYGILKKGHYDVKLTPGEMRRITLWLDCNSNFYGAYSDPEKQSRGELVRPRLGVPEWTDFNALVR